MIDDDQDAVGNSHDCFLLAESACEPVILCREVVVFRMSDGPYDFCQQGAQMGVAFGWFPAQTLASTLLVARVHAGPGGDVFIGGEAAVG